MTKSGQIIEKEIRRHSVGQVIKKELYRSVPKTRGNCIRGGVVFKIFQKNRLTDDETFDIFYQCPWSVVEIPSAFSFSLPSENGSTVYAFLTCTRLRVFNCDWVYLTRSSHSFFVLCFLCSSLRFPRSPAYLSSSAFIRLPPASTCTRKIFTLSPIASYFGKSNRYSDDNIYYKRWNGLTTEFDVRDWQNLDRSPDMAFTSYTLYV